METKTSTNSTPTQHLGLWTATFQYDHDECVDSTGTWVEVHATRALAVASVHDDQDNVEAPVTDEVHLQADDPTGPRSTWSVEVDEVLRVLWTVEPLVLGRATGTRR